MRDPARLAANPDQLQWILDHNEQIRGSHRVQISYAVEAWRADRAALVASRKELADHERIVTRCPSCGSQTLFIGHGGHLTCSLIGCKNPSVADSIKQLEAQRDQAEAPLRALREALAGLLGSSDVAELDQMEAVIRMTPAPDADKAVSINAIHALRAALSGHTPQEKEDQAARVLAEPDWHPIRELVNRQAKDAGLWFMAMTAPEAYLQQELRKLHEAIELRATLSGPTSPPEQS